MSDTLVVPDVTEVKKVESALENVSERSETKDGSATSEVESLPKGDFFIEQVSLPTAEQVPELKTSLGTTFDAVVTDEETTTKVTPSVEDLEEEADHEDLTENEEEIPQLLFSEKTPDASALGSHVKQETPPPAQDEKPQTTEGKNLWTKVFSVVTGSETTAEDVSSEEDDDDEEEDAEAETQPNLGKVEKEPLLSESLNVPENTTDPQDASHPSVGQDVQETKNDEKTLFGGKEMSVAEVIRHEEAFYETIKPTDEPIHHQIGQSVKSVPKDDHASPPHDDQSDNKTQKTAEDKNEESVNAEFNKNDGDTEDSNVLTEQVLGVTFGENKTVTEQELAISTTEQDQDQSTENKESDGSDVNVEYVEEDKLHAQIPENLVTDVESNSSQTGSPVEEAKIHELPHTTEEEDEKDAETEDRNETEKEELLEDENALLLSQSDDVHSENPSPETTQSTESAPEVEYSDSILRLTLLRQHFTEENMARLQRLLGLKNLYKVEAMFSDLDTELLATRVSHTGSTHDIENALESILEVSENPILDEIEKMLDIQEAKQDYELHMNTSSLDEETEVLDDFQELAFSLRQKYSTASDSAPLTETSLDSVQGWFIYCLILLCGN